MSSECIARSSLLNLLGKISSLLTQESEAVLGVEDQIQWFESHVRRAVEDVTKLFPKETLRTNIYDIEDAIDELIYRSSQRWKKDVFIRYVLAFYDVPNHFFHIMALLDLLDHCNLRKKLEQLKDDIRSRPMLCFQSGSWGRSLELYKDQDLNGNKFVRRLVGEFQFLATQMRFKPEVRKQSMWLRDDFRQLQKCLREVESAEESEEKDLWIEEFCEVCRLAEHAIELFRDKQHCLQKKRAGLFRRLLRTPHNFVLQHKFTQELVRIKSKIAELSALVVNDTSATSSTDDDDVDDTGSTGTMVFDNADDMSAIIITDTIDDIDVDDTGSTGTNDDGDLNPTNVDDASGIQGDEDDNADATQTGYDEDIDAITTQLLIPDPRCLTVSIVGVRGTGKTSLAKLIFDSKVIAYHFPRRFWMSQEDMIDFQDRIYRDHVKRPDVWEICCRRMVNSTFGSNKCLVVLDGACWGDIPELDYLLGNRTNGTRIIRTLEYLPQLDYLPEVTQTDFVYRLHLRDNGESWELFRHILNTNIAPELEQNLKKVVLRKCGGLPKSIAEVGRVLSQRKATLEEWSSALNQMNENEQHWSEIMSQINKSLPLKLRRCLFYFGLFPADYDIPARRLIALWVAEGLVRELGEGKSPEDAAEACLKELINYNMVQVTKRKLNGQVRTCCLPEALRVHWFSKASRATFLYNHSNGNTSRPVARRLADHLNQKDPMFDHIHGNKTNFINLHPRYRDVVSFLSFDTRDGSSPGKDIENFLDRCISSTSFLSLCVLDLENVYKPKLPNSVARLTLLRYLGLRSTYLEILPEFVQKLLKLQTLDLKRTRVLTLPSSIWKMQELRHFFLDESLPHVFVSRHEDSSLKDLRTLWGMHVDEESQVKNGLDTLLNITKLGLKCKISMASRKGAMTLQLKAVAGWIMNLKCLRSLRLKSLDETSLPWDLHLESLVHHTDLHNVYLVGKLKNQRLLSNFPINLVELALSGSELVLDDPMQTLDKLPNLRILRLLARSFMGKKMICSNGGFPKLEILKLWGLDVLENWIVEEGALVGLKSLEIRNCTNLKMLPDGLRHLKGLRELKLNKMPEISTRIKDKHGEEWIKIAHVRKLCIED